MFQAYNNLFCLLQNPQYDIKDSTGTLHSGITQTAAYYPYDHSLGQYQYDRWVFFILLHFCRLYVMWELTELPRRILPLIIKSSHSWEQYAAFRSEVRV